MTNKNIIYTMSNMMIIFHFMIIMLKDPILKVDLQKIASIFVRCPIQNGLQIDKM